MVPTIEECAVCGSPVWPDGGSFKHEDEKGRLCDTCLRTGRFVEAFA